MEENQQLNLIEKYLLNRMSKEEVTDFEAKMEKDIDLKEEVEIHKKLQKGMSAYAKKQDFLKMMSEIKEEVLSESIETKEKEAKVVELGKKSSPKTRSLRPFLAIAAGIAILVTAAWFIFFSPPNGPKLANKNLTLYTIKIMTPYYNRSGAADNTNEETLTILKQGTAAYDAGNLQEAKVFFENYQSQSTKKGLLYLFSDFYLAQIALNQKDLDRGIQLLTPLADISNAPFQVQANWYLALAHLGKNNQQEAINHLKKIPSDNQEFKDKANQLLKQLKAN